MPRMLEKSTHPGTFIRERVLPSGMSVTDAAKRLGVGRPAVSNLLNGKSSLSPRMAVRLEKTFGADRQELIDLQAAFDADERRGDEKSIAVRGYVPGFLTIKAEHIHQWPDGNLEARHLLPVLLRKLVHSTGHDLIEVDFPGYDNAERRSRDGKIEAGAATAWIPEGKSCWEFGVNQKPGSKAEGDYLARVRSVSPSERQKCTFVFVTPRNWPGKTEWVESKLATGDWKGVRAYDASDLEQWLEESVAAQIWFAKTLEMSAEGCEALDRFWRRWSAASEPKLTPAIFESSITAHRDTIKEWLENESVRPLLVAADSKGEALAFLACIFQDNSIEPRWGDVAAIFESAETLRKLAASSAPFIPIVCTEEAERELTNVYRQHHCIVVRPRNAVDSNPDIALEMLDQDGFVKALSTMGIEDDQVDKLSRESGRSPTILRRRLSLVDAIRIPEWAQNVEIARSLIAMALIGAWHANSKADRDVVSVLGDRLYEEIEKDIAPMLEFDDAPVWSVGQYRGVASKIDALFAINGQVTGKEINEFFLLAEYVLSETDPGLELPEDERWTAVIHGKVRDHSDALRKGICETLVILSVHGNNLIRDRLGIDVETRVFLLIEKLLTPLTLEKLLSYDHDLPLFAEAAPEAFLQVLEHDLQQPQPVVVGLLQPADSGPFVRCWRSGLLWALECLAWKNLTRVCWILARLSKTVINDNVVNKPITSLGAIYRFWMPQTAASLEERMRALEVLTERFPDIGWKICMDQLNPGDRMAVASYRPRWRSDASGAGQPVKTPNDIREFNEFTHKALNLVLAWPEHNEETLYELVKVVEEMDEKDQTTVWDLVDTWATSESDDRAKADLAEEIRRFALTRLGQRRGVNDAIKDRARAACARLQSGDTVIQHAWLFARHRIDLSTDDTYSLEHYEKIRELRATAMTAICGERGFEGVMAVLSAGGVADIVGDSAAQSITDFSARTGFLQRCLPVAGGLERQIDGCMRGFLRCIDDDVRGAILSAVADDTGVEWTARLFRCAPFKQNTWRLLDGYSEEIKNKYWRAVVPHWNRHSDAELIELTDRLLDAERPRAAFDVVHLDWDRIETSRLKRLLLAVATVNSETKGHYQLDAYYISEALKSLQGRSGVKPDEMAHLEFVYIDALRGSEHGIPNLERRIFESPVIFVEALSFLFKRRDDGQDPLEWKIEDSERQANLAHAGYRVLSQINLITSTGSGRKVDAEKLVAWVTEARRLCDKYGRAEIGDQYIGQVLSRAIDEQDGIWPCVAVCEVLERIASQEINKGFEIGVRNARGAHWREKGGAQERELAAKYRGWSDRLAMEYPYVSRVVESIAASYDQQASWQDDRTNVENRLWR